MMLIENEIRPDILMQEQAARFSRDIQRLNERCHEFVTVPCPACGEAECQERFQKYGLNYVDCPSCGTMYVNPRATPEILAWYYSTSENYQYWNEFIFPASEDARREKIFKPRALRLVELCSKHNSTSGTLLEVGAGFGTFGEEISRLGAFKNYIAVEPTPDLADTCRRKGLKVIEKPIEQIKFDKESISVIASFEVIEHLFSPRTFLLSCARMLDPGGILVLSCPNVRGFEIQVLQQTSDSVDVEHLNYFHPESLSSLLESCGFQVVETLTPGELDAELVRKKVLAEKMSLSGQRFLQQVLIDEWETLGRDFQSFIARSGLSSHMWLVARKTAE